MGDRKINVLFVLHQLGAGGSERVVLDLARNFNESVFNSYVAFFSGGDLLEAMSEACHKVIKVHKKNGFDPGAMIQIAHIIKRNNIDVVNPHHYPPFLYSYLGAKVLNHRCLVFTEHAVAELETYRGRHELLCNLLFTNTHAVIGVSEEITRSFKKKFPLHSGKMITIYNGVDVDRFDVFVGHDDIRAELGILPSEFVIGIVANFRIVKNHACLVKAFYLLTSAFPQARLVLVGRGFPGDPINSENDIKHLVGSLGLEDRVIFTGYRKDIPDLLKSFDVFCLPSFSEGLPVSVLEAMAARVTVVGSDVRGINEVVLNKDTGLLFPSNDSAALAQTLDRLIRNPKLCERLRRNAFGYVFQTHGMRQWIAKYQQVFQDNIKNPLPMVNDV